MYILMCMYLVMSVVMSVHGHHMEIKHILFYSIVFYRRN